MQKTRPWDYLIITAANDQQARSYELQLRRREHAGELRRVRKCLVIQDMEGRRMGSGGSTLHCLTQVLECECSGGGACSFDEAESVLSELRILIVHAGGDSRRLPPYGHCGKMFVPIPDKGSTNPATTLFDRLIPSFLDLPEGQHGQVVIASGDALIFFDPSTVDLSRPGITALGMWAPSREGAHHGVFCAGADGRVTRYLQKPLLEGQVRAGAVNHNQRSVLDLGVMSCDATAAVQLLRAFFTLAPRPEGEPGLVWKQKSLEIVRSHGVDFYREICCAMGTDTMFVQYVQNLRAGGAYFEAVLTAEWFRSLHDIPLHVSILPCAKFLHFGTTRQLITSGVSLLKQDAGKAARTTLILNSDIQGEVVGNHAWIEGCSVDTRLVLEGWNVLVGADISEPLTLSKGACFDMSMGINRDGEKVWFLRCYDVDDSFKQTADTGGTFCGILLRQWLHEMGGVVSDIWAVEVPPQERTLWNARVFPALKEHREFREWWWLFHAGSATTEQKSRFWAADRYSSSEIAVRVDQLQFHARRNTMRSRARHADDGGPIPVGTNCRSG